MRALQRRALASSLRTLSQDLSATLECLADAIFPKSVVESTDSLLAGFLATTFDAPGHRVEAAEFYESFLGWCDAGGHEAPGKNTVLQALPPRIVKFNGSANVLYLGNVSLTDVSSAPPLAPLAVVAGKLRNQRPGPTPAKRRKRKAATAAAA
jgi:hypothetical protein